MERARETALNAACKAFPASSLFVADRLRTCEENGKDHREAERKDWPNDPIGPKLRPPILFSEPET
jgi:hypothetical protein